MVGQIVDDWHSESGRLGPDAYSMQRVSVLLHECIVVQGFLDDVPSQLNNLRTRLEETDATGTSHDRNMIGLESECFPWVIYQRDQTRVFLIPA